MKCYQNFSMFEDNQTPMGIENLPDQMKPIAEKNCRNDNFDIILSKYFNNGELTDVQLQQLNAHQKIVFEDIKKKAQTKTKRPDEYQKLFFKKAFKFAEHAFFKKNKKNRSRRMSQFYHHHFDSVASTLKIPLINFYHPDKKTKPGLSTGQKSFNSSYVKTVLKSLSFRKVCIEYHGKFKEDCKKERNKKISTFTRSLSSIVDHDKQDQTKLIKFLQSSKCKIPWTDRQIDEAYKRAGEDLDDYSIGTQKKEEEWAEETEKGILDEFEDSPESREGIELLEYNDITVQEKKENGYAFNLAQSQLSSENGLNLGLSLDLMKI